MPLNYLSVLLVLLAAINTVGFFMAAADKRKATKKRRRIPEKWFFLLSLMGGCPGVYAGLLIFRHKTRHWYFMWGIPVLFVLQLGILFFLFIVWPA